MIDQDKKILLVGATGVLGKPVALALQNAGCRVKILCRDADRATRQLGEYFEYCRGDILNLHDVKNALYDCQAVYLNLKSDDNFNFAQSTEILGVKNIFQAAAQHPIEWLSCISGAGNLEQHADLPPLKIKFTVEQLIQSGSIPYTIFKPTHFMESLPLFVRNGKPSIPGKQPHHYHYLAAADYARLVVSAWTQGLYKNKKVTVLGPETFTMREALEIYSEICLENAKVTTIALPIIRLIATISRNKTTQSVVTLFRTFQQVAEDLDEESITVRPENSIRLEQWCRKQAAITSGW